MKCPHCNNEISDEAKFCPYCGNIVNKPREDKNVVGETLNRITEKMTGEEIDTKLKMRDLFSGVFRRHTKQESENIFLAGFTGHEVEEKDLSSTWPKPWLFSRVFAYLFITTAMLSFMLTFFQNPNAYAGLIFIGSCCVPISLLVFMFEANVPRNISIIDVIKLFFIGGVASLLVTLMLFEFSVAVNNEFLYAITIGIVEETGKLIVTYVILKRSGKNRYILNGLLIGAAVGCGFAVFESAGYAFRFAIEYGTETMYSVILQRNLLAVGGHISWAAIAGGAMVLSRGDRPFFIVHTAMGKKFWYFFGACILLHAVWDMPFALTNIGAIVFYTVLCISAITLVFVLINAGLKQVSDIAYRANHEVVHIELPTFLG